ncbi:MAG TPA: 2OG-Fe(II) oxygenase [Acidimicrobiia bacterium]|nr:2OG-Fe(II) oxygenase [Acidimicrobiia bacterium]
MSGLTHSVHDRTWPFRPSLEDLFDLGTKSAEAFAAARPFPHAVFDDVFDDDLLRQVAAELPDDGHPGWSWYERPTERKRTFDRPEYFGPAARTLAEGLNSSEFVRFLERLSGIDGLISDPHLTSAGYMCSDRGGFLDIHIDFARNPKLRLVRRLNAILYLNDGWQRAWGGQLELRESLDGETVAEVVPVMNRMVVFSTPDAPHGHPVRVNAPDGRSRLCFSTYYFTSPEESRSRAANHGVLFSERQQVRPAWKRALESVVPPVVIEARRRRKRQRRAANGGR